MKRAFVRAIWGEVASHRDGKIQKEILETEDRDWFTVFAFGDENYKWLLKNGFKSELVTNDPVIWDLETRMYRHKLEVFDVASELYEEFVFLDWDCVPTKDFSYSWEELGRKEVFQANLFQYRTKKCLWRTTDHRKVCNGGFAYFRERTAPRKMIEFWDEFEELIREKYLEREKRGLDLRFREKSLIFDDEPAMTKYIDYICNGWCGLDKYWELFEPEVCNVRKKSAFPKEMINSKNSCFMHNL